MFVISRLESRAGRGWRSWYVPRLRVQHGRVVVCSDSRAEHTRTDSISNGLRSYSLLVSESFPYLLGIRHSLVSLLRDLPDNCPVPNNGIEVLSEVLSEAWSGLRSPECHLRRIFPSLSHLDDTVPFPFRSFCSMR